MEAWGLLSILLLVIATAALSVILYIIWPHWTFQRLGIPGPKPGLLGILGIMRKKGVVKMDMELFHKYGKFIGVYQGRHPVLLTADPDLLKQICVKDFSTFPNRPFPPLTNKLIKTGLLMAADDHWRAARSILSPTFSSGKMRNMSQLIHAALDKLLDNIRQKMKVDNKIEAKRVFGAFTMDVIASTGFGLEVDSQTRPDDPFVKNARKIFEFGTRFKIAAVINGLFPFMAPVFSLLGIKFFGGNYFEFFKEVIGEVIDDRSKEAETKRKDLLQLMLNAREGAVFEAEDDIDRELKFQHASETNKSLTKEQILANSVLFIIAGYETTATTLTNAAYLLATNPDCQRRLAEEISSYLAKAKPTYDTIWKLPYLDNVISETLRLYPALVRTRRICSEDHVVNGVKIPKGMEVNFSIYSIHHDPDLWPEPEKFDPDRFLPENKAKRHPYAWAPFGVGPRNCIGMRLALLEIKMVLATLMQHFRIVTCPDTKIPMELRSTVALSGPAHDVFLRLEAV